MKKLGTVSGETLENIKCLYLRKTALVELTEMLNMSKQEVSGTLYNRIIDDLMGTSAKINVWWKETAKTNQWDFDPDDTWKIDFDSGAVYII